MQPEDVILPVPPDGWTAPPDWTAVFGRSAPLAVEIGPGKGVFMVRIASSHPDWNFVGIELRRDRVVLGARKAVEAALENVRYVEGRAEERTRELFGPASVKNWYINFPDPWPKRRHHPRRLIQPAYAAALAERTAPGGIVYLASDDPDYGDQMLRVFEAAVGEWENLHGAGKWSTVGGDHSRTVHEEKFLAWGRSIRYLQFRRRKTT